MSRRIDPLESMWSQAWEMLSQAERMHRQFFRLASSPCAQATWEPPADVFEDARQVVIVVAMPGVESETLETVVEAGVLVVTGERPFPRNAAGCAVRQLELPYGHFERRVALPPVALELESHQLEHGCLTLRFRKHG